MTSPLLQTAPFQVRFLQSPKKMIHVEKETYMRGKRDLYMRLKRPIHETKETSISISGKRDL